MEWLLSNSNQTGLLVFCFILEFVILFGVIQLLLKLDFVGEVIIKHSKTIQTLSEHIQRHTDVLDATSCRCKTESVCPCAKEPTND